jgi:alkylhydroperoxidase family enzyme
MARIAPIAWEDLSDEVRQRIEAGMATGMYSMTLPLQIVAHSPNAFRGMDDGYKAIFGISAIGQRTQELMRLRSAQLGACAPCSLSRKDESISEEDVACLTDPTSANYTPQERLAIRMVDLMAMDPHSIDDDLIREMAEVFTVEQIVELGWYAGQVVGGHRFMHMLDALNDSEPIIGAPAKSAN